MSVAQRPSVCKLIACQTMCLRDLCLPAEQIQINLGYLPTDLFNCPVSENIVENSKTAVGVDYRPLAI